MIREIMTLAAVAAFAAAAFAQEPPTPVQDPPKPGESRKEDPAKAPPRLELGKVLPVPFTLADLDGQEHGSVDLAGKVVVVDFWSTTCPISQGWESRLAAIHAEYAARDVVFLIVNSNEGNGEFADKEPKQEGDKPYQSIRNYLAEHELPYTVLIDPGSRVADLFQAVCTPHTFVFDTKGVLVYRGSIDDDSSGRKGERAKPYLRMVLDRLLAGDAVEPSSTTPVGCSIKRPAGAQGERRGRRR